MSKDNKAQEKMSKADQAIYDHYLGKSNALEKGFGVLGKFAQMAMDLGKGNGKNGQEAAKIIMMQGLKAHIAQSMPVVESVDDSASLIGGQSPDDEAA